MRYWNMAGQRYFPGLVRCRRALRLSADRAGNAARKPARKAGFSTFESRSGRETDCLLEDAGFEPSVPRQGTAFFTEGNELYPLPINHQVGDRHQAKSG